MSSPSENGETDVPLMTLKDELSALTAYMKTETYSSFVSTMQGEYEEMIDKILNAVPQTRGDELEREQAIGAAKNLKAAFEFFSEYKARLVQQISEREAPKT